MALFQSSQEPGFPAPRYPESEADRSLAGTPGAPSPSITSRQPSAVDAGDELGRAASQLRQILAELAAVGEPTLVGRSSAEDDVEIAGFVVEDQVSDALRQVLVARAEQVARAEARAAMGSSGRCEVCEAALDPERLEIVPEATRCVPCQREWDRRH